MKTTTRKETAIQETAKSDGARRMPGVKPGDERARKAEGDRQIAEIERTFTIHYEW